MFSSYRIAKNFLKIASSIKTIILECILGPPAPFTLPHSTVIARVPPHGGYSAINLPTGRWLPNILNNSSRSSSYCSLANAALPKGADGRGSSPLKTLAHPPTQYRERIAAPQTPSLFCRGTSRRPPKTLSRIRVAARPPIAPSQPIDEGIQFTRPPTHFAF